MALLGPDYSRLNTTLVSSKTAKDNNALFQTITGLIEGLRRFQESITGDGGIVSTINSTLSSLVAQVASLVTKVANSTITLVEVNCSAAPQTVSLSEVIVAFTIIKDSTGNAGTNTITMTGVVEGVTNPTITTNYGIFRVYKRADGTFGTW